MSLLPILAYPDPRLKTIAMPVQSVDGRIRKLVTDMLETMYGEEGVGLAATQVDVHEQVIVIDISDDGNQPLVIINPALLWVSEELQKSKEGCLSVPQIYDSVPRAAAVKVRALDEHGSSRELHAEGLLAACIQHELDHLAGKVFIEYLSPLKRNRYLAKTAKWRKEAA